MSRYSSNDPFYRALDEGQQRAHLEHLTGRKNDKPQPPCLHPGNCTGPQCQRCGYTLGDCQLQMDHSRCDGQRPAPCVSCEIRDSRKQKEG